MVHLSAPAVADSLWSRRIDATVEDLSSHTGIDFKVVTSQPTNGVSLRLWLQTTDGTWYSSSETASLSQSTNNGQIAFSNLSRVSPTGPSSPDLTDVTHVAVGETNAPTGTPSFQATDVATFGNTGTVNFNAFAGAAFAGEGEAGSSSPDDDLCKCCPAYPVRVYKSGGLYSTGGTYASVEVQAFDANGVRLFDSHQHNNGTFSGDNSSNGEGCSYVLKGTLADSAATAVTVSFGDGDGSISVDVGPGELDCGEEGEGVAFGGGGSWCDNEDGEPLP